MPTGFQLPFPAFGDPHALRTGFGTPTSDTAPQVCYMPPDRVIPIVFLPGIMGSNLKITDARRMELLGRDPRKPKSNIAWRPDNAGDAVFGAATFSAADRQLILDPATTAVDRYDPGSTTPALDGDARHGNVTLAGGFDSPLLRDDTLGAARGRTATQKARARGWGEVYFESYGVLLQLVESRLQCILDRGKPASGWEAVVGVDPATWGLDPSTPQKALTDAELRAITKGTWFPVHAVGYNWLESNRKSAQQVAGRIREIIQVYEKAHNCPGVVVVTHSMGGLVGRALVHPDMGGLQDEVLGIVHGVQPVVGAAAGYARMHAGFEDPGVLSVDRHRIKASVGAKVAGNYGDEVTAVLANSAGGLQLLPSEAYGNGWLRVRHQGRNVLALPANGDPYEEIYKLQGRWYGLFANPSWINPGHLSRKKGAPALDNAFKLLDMARQFHRDLAGTYHAHTYALYGADPAKRAFGNVTWEIAATCDDIGGWQGWPVVGNDRQGRLTFVEGELESPPPGEPMSVSYGPAVTATLDPPEEAGDQTVPMRSADQQRRSGRCEAVFRQTGYEHQGSYKNEAVLSATLFSILRIAQRVQLP